MFPYYEQGNLVPGLNITSYNAQYINCATPTSPGATPVKILLCPSDPDMPSPAVGMYKTYTLALTSYGGCSGTSPTNTVGTAPPSSRTACSTSTAG